MFPFPDNSVHVYVVAPDAVRTMDSPLQMVSLGAETDIIGGVVFLITVTEPCFVQP